MEPWSHGAMEPGPATWRACAARGSRQRHTRPMHAPYACAVCMRRMHAPYACAVRMRRMHAPCAAERAHEPMHAHAGMHSLAL